MVGLIVSQAPCNAVYSLDGGTWMATVDLELPSDIRSGSLEYKYRFSLYELPRDGNAFILLVW